MKHSLFLILLFLFTGTSLHLFSQQYDYVNLAIRTNKGLPLRYFYKDVTVLDNRVDSVIYREQENLKKLRMITFKGAASIAVAAYIRDRTNHLEKNNERLLINITELRVPNKSVHKSAHPESKNRYLVYARGYIFFSADVYTASDSDSYRKLFSIKRKRFVYSVVKDKIRDILDDLVEVTEQLAMNRAGKKGRFTSAYKSYKNDSCFIEYTGDEMYALAQIGQTKWQQWEHLAVMNKKPDASTCMYPLFENFKNNICINKPFKVVPVDSDSLYEIDLQLQDTGKLLQYPFAVADSSGFYIGVMKNYYVKLRKEGGLFRFTVPSILPDMYQILSLESVQTKDRFRLNSFTDTYYQVSAFDIGPARIPILDIIGLFDKAGKLTRIKNAAHSPYHRNCIVDLDSGDFIYD